jgi:twinfilin-like protein
MQEDPSYIFCKTGVLQTILFITYVPLDAKVRQKMLYASSQATFLKQISVSSTLHSVFASMPGDITESDLTRLASGQSAPLSSAEKDLQQVREAETLEASTLGTTSRKAHTNSGIGFPFTRDAWTLVESTKSTSDSIIHQFRINLEEEEIESESSNTFTNISEALGIISKESPRYSLLCHNSMVVFLYTCPSSSKIKEKMMYSSNKLNFLNMVAEADIELSQKLEAADPSEIDPQDIMPPKTETDGRAKLAFAKPKGPRRKD